MRSASPANASQTSRNADERGELHLVARDVTCESHVQLHVEIAHADRTDRDGWPIFMARHGVSSHATRVTIDLKFGCGHGSRAHELQCLASTDVRDLLTAR